MTRGRDNERSGVEHPGKALRGGLPAAPGGPGGTAAGAQTASARQGAALRVRGPGAPAGKACGGGRCERGAV